MSRAFKYNPSPRFRLPSECRARNGLGEQESRPVKEKCLMRDWTYSLRKQRASSRYRSEMLPVEKRFHLFDGHHAVMISVHPAARWQTRLHGAAKRKQRRDQRKAEQQQQRDGY